MIAEVLIPRPVFRSFNYRVPLEWEPYLFSGSRVQVPFGNQQTLGLISALHQDDSSDSSVELKNLIGPLEAYPFVSQVQLQLIRKIATYYVQSEGETATLFYPRFLPKAQKTLQFSLPWQDIFSLIPATRRSLRSRLVPLSLRPGQSYTRQQLLSEYSLSEAMLRDLKAMGILKESPAFEPLPIPSDFDWTSVSMPELNQEQARAFSGIKELSSVKCAYLHGVTGSGKTEVYISLCKEALSQGKSAILLVPEISLTPQMLTRFRDRFGDLVCVLHSGLGDRDRYLEWVKVRSGCRRLVVGARSALFAPMQNLGLVILDEEGESSYKQDTAPLYDARQVAQWLCQLSGAQLVFGSATPSIHAWQGMKTGDYSPFHLRNRYQGTKLPKIELIDLKSEFHRRNYSVFSHSLKAAMQSEIALGNQVILFVNRRGHSSFVMCRSCSLVLQCERCQVSLTYHDTSFRLHCHYCNYSVPIPSTCPSCQSTAIKYFGIGTQKVEWFFQKEFPGVTYARIDTDVTAKQGALEEILYLMKTKRIQVLIGTQMIAKGLDFADVTLVGVLNADAMVKMPDYSACERALTLLVQIAGRAGRREKQGRMLVQTYQPQHPVYQHLLNQDTDRFLADEYELRCALHYPPAATLIHVQTSSEMEPQAEAAIHAVHQLMQKSLVIPQVYEITPAQKSPIEKIDNRYRYRFLIKARYDDTVATILRNIREEYRPPTHTRLKIIVDADNLL